MNRQYYDQYIPREPTTLLTDQQLHRILKHIISLPSQHSATYQFQQTKENNSLSTSTSSESILSATTTTSTSTPKSISSALWKSKPIWKPKSKQKTTNQEKRRKPIACKPPSDELRDILNDTSYPYENATPQTTRKRQWKANENVDEDERFHAPQPKRHRNLRVIGPITFHPPTISRLSFNILKNRQQRYRNVYRNRLNRVLRKYKPQLVSYVNGWIRNNGADVDKLHRFYNGICVKLGLIACIKYEAEDGEAEPDTNEEEQKQKVKCKLNVDKKTEAKQPPPTLPKQPKQPKKSNNTAPQQKSIWVKRLSMYANTKPSPRILNLFKVDTIRHTNCTKHQKTKPPKCKQQQKSIWISRLSMSANTKPSSRILNLFKMDTNIHHANYTNQRKSKPPKYKQQQQQQQTSYNNYIRQIQYPPQNIIKLFRNYQKQRISEHNKYEKQFNGNNRFGGQGITTFDYDINTNNKNLQNHSKWYHKPQQFHSNISNNNPSQNIQARQVPSPPKPKPQYQHNSNENGNKNNIHHVNVYRNNDETFTYKYAVQQKNNNKNIQPKQQKNNQNQPNQSAKWYHKQYQLDLNISNNNKAAQNIQTRPVPVPICEQVKGHRNGATNRRKRFYCNPSNNNQHKNNAAKVHRNDTLYIYKNEIQNTNTNNEDVGKKKKITKGRAVYRAKRR